MSTFIALASIKTIIVINPTTIALSILTISLMVSVVIFKKTLVRWLAFVLILTFSSGMITLFIYVASLSPNEKIKINKKNLILVVTILIARVPIINSEVSKISIKTFSRQTFIFVIAIIILVRIVAIATQRYNPTQAASSNF